MKKNSTIIPKMIERIIEDLEELAKGDYSIDDIISLVEALEEISNMLDLLSIKCRDK